MSGEGFMANEFRTHSEHSAVDDEMPLPAPPGSPPVELPTMPNGDPDRTDCDGPSGGGRFAHPALSPPVAGGSIGEQARTIEILRRALAWHGDRQRMATTREEWQQEIDAAILWVKQNPEDGYASFPTLAALTNPTRPASVSGEVVTELRDALNKLDECEGDSSYAEHAVIEAARKVAASPKAATPSAVGGDRPCPVCKAEPGAPCIVSRGASAAPVAGEAPAAPTPGGEVLRSTPKNPEAPTHVAEEGRSEVHRFVHEHLPPAFNERSTRYRAGVQVEVARLMREAHDALAPSRLSGRENGDA